MIIYRKRCKAGEGRLPSWVEDPQPTIDIAGKTHVFPGGDPEFLGVPPEGTEWHECAEDWECALMGDPSAPARTQQWADVAGVEDMDKNVWLAPKIMTPEGTRAFRVKFGGDAYQPVLSEEQHRISEITDTARQAVVAAAHGTELDLSVVCGWAAELMTVGHQLHRTVVQELALLDQMSAIAIVLHATGLSPLEVTDAVA